METNREQSLTDQVTDVAGLFRSQFDADGFVSLMQSEHRFRVVGLSSTIERFQQVCGHVRPEIAVIDVSACERLTPLLSGVAESVLQEHVQSILFLDVVPNRARAREALKLPNAGYITRQRTFHQFVAALTDVKDGHIPLDGFEVSSLHGGQAVDPPWRFADSPLASLTAREVDVLQLMAEGRSVTESASMLRLSANTVENHKTRLMRKLGVRKASQLTLIAVREGLIVP